MRGERPHLVRDWNNTIRGSLYDRVDVFMYIENAGAPSYTERADDAIDALLSGRYDGQRTVIDYSEDRFYLPLRDAPYEPRTATTEEKLRGYFDVAGWPYGMTDEAAREDFIHEIVADPAQRQAYLQMIRNEEM